MARTAIGIGGISAGNAGQLGIAHQVLPTQPNVRSQPGPRSHLLQPLAGATQISASDATSSADAATALLLATPNDATSDADAATRIAATTTDATSSADVGASQASVTASDAASAADAAALLLAPADATSTADAPTRVALTGVDASSSADVGASQAGITAADSTVDADAATLIAATASESTSTADVGSQLALTATDATSGADAASASLLASDATVGADVASQLTLVSAEATSGADAVTLIASTASDATTSADTAAAGAFLSTADATASADAPTAIAFTTADAVSGADGSGPDQTGVAVDATASSDAVTLLATAASDTTSGADAPFQVGLSAADATSSADVGSLGAVPITASDATSTADAAVVVQGSLGSAIGEAAGWSRGELVLRRRRRQRASIPKPLAPTFAATFSDATGSSDDAQVFATSEHADAVEAHGRAAVISIVVGDGVEASDQVTWLSMGVSEASCGVDVLGMMATRSSDRVKSAENLSARLYSADFGFGSDRVTAERLPWTLEERNQHAVLYSINPGLAAAKYREGKSAEPRTLELVKTGDPH